MEKEKQIEEMAKITCQMYRREEAKKCAGVQNCDCKCLQYNRCEALYNLGYRKASEVAREIIKDLVDFADDKERHRRINGHGVWYIDEGDVKIGITDFIDELKKKYLENENENRS